MKASPNASSPMDSGKRLFQFRACLTQLERTRRGQTKSWSKYRELFEDRLKRSIPAISTLPRLSKKSRQALCHSLAIFQAGEAGEGRLAREIAQFKATDIDENYRHACRLFVAEEARHGRILYEIIQSLGPTTKYQFKSERLFVFVRRVAGIRFKLLVLLIAELVGFVYYSFLCDFMPSSSTAQALSQIRDDEVDHLYFHMDFFSCLCRSKAHVAIPISGLVLVIGIMSFGLVALEHRAALSSIGAQTTDFLLTGWQMTASISALLFLSGVQPRPIALNSQG